MSNVDSSGGCAIKKITLSDINDMQVHVAREMKDMTAMALSPHESKPPPFYNAAQLAVLCGVSARTMLNKLDRAAASREMPSGIPENATTQERSRRKLNLEEARIWIKALNKRRYVRAEGQEAAVIAVANFKGGVGKTTLAVNLAQGLTLKGYDVLFIDMDPQGSATSLLGFNPSAIDREFTFLPLAAGDRDTIDQSIVKTYWDGLELVPGNTELFASEFWLPARVINAHSEGKVFPFEEVLAKGIEGIRGKYDYIIIDNPPAISYSTMNSFWAADALLMPLVPDGLTMTSSSHFWTLFSEMAEHVADKGAKSKEYSWIGILPSMTKSRADTQLMLQWMQSAYQTKVMRTEIPDNAVIPSNGAKMLTLYDVNRYEGGARTFNVARAAFNSMVDEIEAMTRSSVWKEEPKKARPQ